MTDKQNARFAALKESLTAAKAERVALKTKNDSLEAEIQKMNAKAGKAVKEV